MSIDTSSPEFQHQCLVRWAISYGMKHGTAALQLWFVGYEKKSGDTGLRLAAEQQWALGNRGRKGQWMTEEVATHG